MLVASTLLILSSFLLIAFLCYSKWKYQHWRKKNFPYLEPQIPFGNFRNALMGKENKADTVKKLYDEMKRRGWQHGGIFNITTPTYLPINLDYLKNILIKDFQYFTDRFEYYNEEKDPISAHLMHLTGERWQNLRNALTPAFTSHKLRATFDILLKTQDRLLQMVEEERKIHRAVNIRSLLTSFTINMIGVYAFGLDCDKDNSTFQKYCKKVLDLDLFRNIKRMFCQSFPKFALSLGLSETPKDVADFFMHLVEDTVEFRKRSGEKKNDLLQIMIQMKNDEVLMMKEIAAQCYLFFLAGFETSSSSISTILYELGRNQKIQDRVRKEIRSVLERHGGKITYDSLQEMKYMTQVIDEGFRLHPPVPLLHRACSKDYKLPDEDLTIEKGTVVVLPILGIHLDEEYYPNPEVFDPERFNDEERVQRHKFAHLPFGDGPRNCIGFRLGWIQVKLALACLLKDYKFTVDPKTIEPLKLDPNCHVAAVVGGIWLNIEKI